jgi:ubiquinone/menaquinone biosynthesis C-methylase UbiE
MHRYVHGYSERETQRLREQSNIIEELFHHDTVYPAGSRVLEVGCGVGAQTIILAGRNPDAEFLSIDISEQSLEKAAELIRQKNISNVRFQCGTIFDLPFQKDSFDHVFICFVLEHLNDPVKALVEGKRVLKTGGTVTVIEGDHGSFFWHPQTEAGLKVWNCLIIAQQRLGHDPLIGRKLFPLLCKAGFTVEKTYPRPVYGDGLSMNLMGESINKIMIPMLESVKSQALKLKLIEEKVWEQGIKDLYEASISKEGSFYYSWFKAVAVK